jgi:hypothetical protein
MKASFRFRRVYVYITAARVGESFQHQIFVNPDNSFYFDNLVSIEVDGRFLVYDTEGGTVSTQRWDGGSGGSRSGGDHVVKGGGWRKMEGMKRAHISVAAGGGYMLEIVLV